MAQTEGLPELLDAIRWRWKLIALIALSVFIGGTVYVENLPNEYEGEAIVAFAPRPDVETAGPDSVRVLVPSYQAYVTAPATVADIAEDIDADPDELGKAIDATVAVDTGNLTISVQLGSPEEAAAAANAFADDVVDFVNSKPDSEAQLRADLIAPALPNDTPAAPARRLLEAGALFVGLLLGLSISFLVERGRPRLRSWRDMADASGHPVLGRIPSSRRLRTKPTEAFSEPKIGAAFRTLRTNLEQVWQDRTVDVVIVTSPSPGDGKTSVAALFAESLARLGAEVLLVDADLRRPGLSRLMKGGSDAGFESVLRGRVAVTDIVEPGWTDGLFVLRTNPDPEAGDLLAKRFGQVIREARAKFDIVIVDTPPLLGTDDSRTLALEASGVLLVVAGGSMAQPLGEAIMALERVNAPILGIVGNRLREAHAGYYT